MIGRILCWLGLHHWSKSTIPAGNCCKIRWCKRGPCAAIKGRFAV